LSAERDEVVVLAVTGDPRLVGGIGHDRGVVPDPFDEFLPRSGAGVAGELGPLQHVLELIRIQGTLRRRLGRRPAPSSVRFRSTICASSSTLTFLPLAAMVPQR